MATPVLPYPDMDFTPLDILTAAEMDQMVANDQYLRDFCAGLADGTNLSDGVIQARNLDFTTMPYYETHSTTNMNIGSGATSFVTVLSLQIADPGYYYVYGYCGVYKASTSEVCDVRTRIQGGNWMPYSIIHMYGSGQYEGGTAGGIIEITSPNTTINLQVNQTNSNITMRTEYLRNMCAFRVG